MDSKATPAFAELLRRYRAVAGLTQEELAARSGLTPQAISLLERGERQRPQAYTFEKLAEVLELAEADRARFAAAARTPLSTEVPLHSGEHPVHAPRTNLPFALSSLIGRKREQGMVLALLERARLVTLTGAGGVGKTRLALAVGGAALSEYPQGVWLVELAALADPGLVAGAVAQALGLREEPGRPLLATLSDHLRDRHVLLVLDNCEHLIGACAELAAALLTASPRPRLLATSRERLEVAGEQCFRVPSLAVPDPSHLPPLAELDTYEAVQLFVERAQARQPEFALTAHNAWEVAEVCARLDGIPLALELAAARVGSVPVAGIAARLDGRLQLLTGGSRTALPRQRTLRATLDWSYALLSAPERALLARLAVFSGGWTLEAAEAVGAGEDVEAPEELDGLAGLVDKSLVQLDEQEGSARYGMLETMRTYGLERLEASGEVEAVRRRHAEHYLALVETAEPELVGPEQIVWGARLEREHDNLRAALRWAQDSGDAAMGLRLAGALWRFWSTRGHLSEGRGWLEGFLALSGRDRAQKSLACAKALVGASRLAIEQGAYEHARVLCGESVTVAQAGDDKRHLVLALINLGILARQRGDDGQAVAFHEEALALARALDDKRSVADALSALAMVGRSGDFTRAEPLIEEALALYRALGDVRRVATGLAQLGLNAYAMGQYERAEALCQESLPLLRDLGDTGSIAEALWTLGLVARSRGDCERAAARLEESLALRRERGDERSVAASLGFLGLVALDQGEYERAEGLLEESLALLQGSGVTWDIPFALVGLGHAVLRRNEYERAAALLREGLQVQWAMGDAQYLGWCLEGLAAVAWAHGLPVRAARLCGAADALRRELPGESPADRAAHQRTVMAARAALGDEAFAAAWAAGRALLPEQLIDEALHDGP